MNEMYTYKEKTYELIKFATMKDPYTGEWSNCVVYANASGQTFVRELEDFMNKFTRVTV